MVTHEINSMIKRKKPEIIKLLPRIFDNIQEARFAFSLIDEAILTLKVEDSRDNRLMISFNSEEPLIGIEINKKNFLKFYRPNDTKTCKVEIPLLANKEGSDNKYLYLNPDRSEYEPDINFYKIPINNLIDNKIKILENYKVVLQYIFSRNKKPELIKNPDRRTEEEIAVRDIFMAGVRDKEELCELFQDFNNSQIRKRKPEYSIKKCAEETNIDEELLAKCIRSIERKGQIILYGPPGTGKTYMAEHLAKHIIGGGDGFNEIVQFHPAYTYEDFIQGIRPQSNEGTLEYPMVPGRFYEFCRKAELTPDDKCVLIIDEINRADPARVLGELMFLIERRGEEIPLASGGHFCVPKNVLIIGTMNTADRSIALVDHALRRRFAFIRLSPDFEVLRRYHKKNETKFPIDNLIKVLESLNDQIGDKHYEVGISFFMHKELSKYLEDIWIGEIEPYLEEYYFDHPNNVEKFRWANIRSKIIV